MTHSSQISTGYQILVQKVFEREKSFETQETQIIVLWFWSSENWVAMHQNLSFNTWSKNLNFSASQLNFDWFENALKFEFHAYAIFVHSNLIPRKNFGSASFDV